MKRLAHSDKKSRLIPIIGRPFYIVRDLFGKGRWSRDCEEIVSGNVMGKVAQEADLRRGGTSTGVATICDSRCGFDLQQDFRDHLEASVS
jgi:hypothetical protein